MLTFRNANLKYSFSFKDKPCYAFSKKNILTEEELIPTEDTSIIDISHLPFGATTDAIE